MEEQQFEEINLADYVKILVKRKRTIIVIFLIAIITAAIFSFATESIYNIDTVLEVGKINGELIEPKRTLEERVEQDALGLIIRKEYDILKEDYPKIRAQSIEGTNFVRLEAQSSNPEKVKDILEKKNQLILEQHEEKFQEHYQNIQESLKEIESQLEFLRNHKAYADQGIAQLQLKVSQKKEGLVNSYESEIIKNPTISEYPVKPNKKLNIAIASILGLFLGVFCAFTREWWQENYK